jgi:hypothetical protein
MDEKEYQNAPEEIFDTFDFDFTVVMSFCFKNLQIIDDRIRYLSWVKKMFYQSYNGKEFLLDSTPSKKISIKNIEIELEHLQEERKSNKNERSDHIIDDYATAHPSFELDADKIIIYSRLFTEYKNKIKYLESKIRILDGISKPINHDNQLKYNEKHIRGMTETEIKVFTNEQVEADLGKIKITLEKIERLKKEISRKVESNNNIKKEPIIINISQNIRNSDKIKWLGNKEQLAILLQLLQHHYIIEDIRETDPKMNKYFAIFVDKKNNNFTETEPEMIHLLVDISELIYIIRDFTETQNILIGNNRKWKRISNVILDKEGGRLKPGSLSSMKAKENIPENNQILDKIIKAVRATK